MFYVVIRMKRCIYFRLWALFSIVVSLYITSTVYRKIVRIDSRTPANIMSVSKDTIFLLVVSLLFAQFHQYQHSFQVIRNPQFRLFILNLIMLNQRMTSVTVPFRYIIIVAHVCYIWSFHSLYHSLITCLILLHNNHKTNNATRDKITV